VDFDADKSWDEKKQIYRMSNKIVRTMNITQSAVGDKRGLCLRIAGNSGVSSRAERSGVEGPVVPTPAPASRQCATVQGPSPLRQVS
jgi:hypothetical protein